ncbi:MAG: plastocyanin/azurin family copper-binding protein [Longimicrobiales bacterium]|nr:plastocyanin/azurin family copper-binding protein [Longimicrobiales bacterium]
MTRRSAAVAAVLAFGLGGFTACGSGDGGTSPNGNGNGASDVVEVQAMGDLTFSPPDVTIEPGTTVRWVNESGIFHTVTPDGHTEWASADLSDGTTFEHTFNTEGTFPYYCEPHVGQGMTGTITVESGGTGTY